MEIEVCILAGGLSTRMGRDKSRLRLGGRTMLSVIRETASRAGFKVRTLRRDLVPRCGPLGGIYSGIKTTKAEGVIFLACDMPFITGEILGRLTRVGAANPGRAVFFVVSGKVSFPFLIKRAQAARVAQLIEKQKWSVQSLARALQGKRLRCLRKWLGCFQNINTWEELERAREIVRGLEPVNTSDPA